MSARSKTILVPLCCLIFGALIESSGLRKSQHAVSCLRKCRLDRREEAKTSVQLPRNNLPCHEQCLLGRQAPHGLIGEAINQRRRKSLQNKPDATNSATECPSPIRAPSSTQWTPSEVSLVFGQYVNTTYWYVNATWTSMNDSLGNWDGILVQLSVEIQNILVDPLYCYVLLKNQTFFTANISKLNYQYPLPVYFKVTGLPFTDWMSGIQLYLPATPEANPPSTPMTTYNSSAATTEANPPSTAIATRHASATTEATPPRTPMTTHNASGKPPSSSITEHVPSTSITAYTESTATTEANPPSTAIATRHASGSRNATGSGRVVVQYVTISLGVLVGLIFIAGVVWYLRRPKPLLLPSDYKYYAFIIYKNEDTSFAKELLNFLEEEHHLTCCIHYRDFIPGESYEKNMAKAVDNSYKVIAVFSKNFLLGNFTGYEMELAIHRLVKRQDNSLIVIRIDDVDCKSLPHKIKKRNFIDYNSLLERPFWKRRLLTFLGHSEDSVNQENGDGYRLITGRPAFGRLDSTTSNDSTITYV